MKSDLERAQEEFAQHYEDEYAPLYALTLRASEDGGQFRPILAAMLAFAKSECATRDAEIERLREARNLAYGLLWGMSIDRRRRSDDLAARARETLMATMTKDEQATGIGAAVAALSNKDAG